MPLIAPAPQPPDHPQPPWRAETEAVRERIWARWQAWALVFAAEQRVGAREVRP